MVRVLSDAEIADCLDLGDLLEVVREAFVKQGRGEVERPDRPHFPVGAGLDCGDSDHPADPTDADDSADLDDPCGTGLVMPAYVHGAQHYATKLVGVHEGNAERGLPTVNAQIALTEAATGLPTAYLAGTRITNARTGCIGGLAAAELGVPSSTPDGESGLVLALVGAGTQARWQARAIAAATDLASVRVYSPSDSRDACAADLRGELDLPSDAIRAADSPEEAVSGADVVVTATTATDPVFPGGALDPGALVVAVGAYTAGMRELDAETFERASRVFADVPEEVAEIGDTLEADVAETDLIPFSAVLEGRAGRGTDDEILIVESVGTAVLDAAAAGHVFDRADERGVGEEISL
ncbi:MULTISPECIES: ornithine cyclodeaminase family protein [Halorussus]|uniref:ornithine cyclodeaminase family protein n=1 Tax=Halorussus TaxID=1070314 RepID=UPI000E20EC61|nr:MULTISPECIES: ornithine cyclodeaminase family protein [Halorussus]NHN61065.1 ornithine cyclodeaminase family protein [Halorussus sp. JP-T4]